MNSPGFPYRIFPLGDTAITIDFGNCIDADINNEVIARFSDWQRNPLPGMTEAVPAYSSLTVYYDLLKVMDLVETGRTAFEWMKEKAEERLKQPVRFDDSNQRLIRVPVCYEKEFAPDIIRLAAAKKIETDEVIQLHTSLTYKVFMLGFLPGFAYMGEVNEKIAIPRKSKPVNMKAGSVGIAGKQTGIYPLDSPGGWQIIGRTPMQLFDRKKVEPTLFRAGDAVQFYSITRNTFEEMQNAASPPD